MIPLPYSIPLLIGRRDVDGEATMKTEGSGL